MLCSTYYLLGSHSEPKHQRDNYDTKFDCSTFGGLALLIGVMSVAFAIIIDAVRLAACAVVTACESAASVSDGLITIYTCHEGQSNYQE